MQTAARRPLQTSSVPHPRTEGLCLPSWFWRHRIWRAGSWRRLATGSLATATLVAFSAAARGAESAAAAHWVQASPLGGAMTALAQSPAAPRTLYAAAQSSAVFASEDGGVSWRARTAAPLGDPYEFLLADAGDPLTVQALDGAGQMWTSRDGGQTWTAAEAGLPPVYALAQDGASPYALLAATTGGLYRSTDAGSHWQLLAFAGSTVTGVAVDPRAGANLIAGTFPPGSGGPITLWRSTDGGSTWTATGFQVPLPAVADARSHLLFDRARPETCYAFFIPAPFAPGLTARSTDGGASWAVLPSAPSLLDLLPAANGALYGAAADLGVVRSRDGGDSWQAAPAAGGRPRAPHDRIVRLALTGASNTVAAAGGEGIWRTADGGATWSDSDQGVVALPAFSIAAAPAGDDTVLAVAGDSVYRSADLGSHWQRVHSAFDGPQPDVLSAFDPRLPRTVYGIGNDGQSAYLVKSALRGRDWTRLPLPYSCGGQDSICDVEVSGFALDPQGSGRVYTSGSYFYHFGGSGPFLVRSDDDFQTYASLADPGGLQAQALAVDPANSSLVYALTCGGLFRSTNAGAAWQAAGRGLPAPCSGVTANLLLVVDPRSPGRLLVTTGNRGVWSSNDGGRTFQAMNRGLETAPISSLIVDPTNSGKLYAAVARRGVYRWAAEALAWVPFSDGLPAADCSGALALDPQRPSVLYAGTLSQGVFHLVP